LNDLIQLAGKPKLLSVDFSSIVAKIVTIIEIDKTIAVAKLAIECIPLLAKSLKKDFGQYAKPLVAPLLSRFKEKKFICDVVMSALDALDMHSLSFLDSSDGNICVV
jgi:hypothetical protein